MRKTLFTAIIFLPILASAEVRPAFRCAAECLGVDLMYSSVYQLGRLEAVSYESKLSALRDLGKLCGRKLGMSGAFGKPTLATKFSSSETSGHERWGRQLSIYDYYGWSIETQRWERSTWTRSISIKYADEKSCYEFVQDGVPEYEGDLPVQG